MHGDLHQEEHSQIQQICSLKIEKILGKPPDENDEQAIKDEQSDMQPGYGLKRIDIFLILRGQFKTTFELEMPDLTKPPRRIKGQVIVATVKDYPRDHPRPGTCCQPAFHSALLH